MQKKNPLGGASGEKKNGKRYENPVKDHVFNYYKLKSPAERIAELLITQPLSDQDAVTAIASLIQPLLSTLGGAPVSGYTLSARES